MDKDKLLRKYLDGDLSPEEERRALHIIADDPEMRSIIRFEQKLSDTFPQELFSFDEQQVPEDFTDSVMHRIEQKERGVATDGFVERVKSWYRQLWIPQQVQWRPVYALALAFLVLISFSYPLMMTQNQTVTTDPSGVQSVNQSVQQVSSRPEEVMLRFVYIDNNAHSIAVAGDFNNWEPVELDKKMLNGEIVWTGLVSMSRGEHSYMFVKNGEKWVTDPLAPVQRDDGFGNKNAVIYI